MTIIGVIYDKMNKQTLLNEIANSVRKKHPWKISQERYLSLFPELPKTFLEERIAYDNLLEKVKRFSVCNLVLTQVKIEINLTLDELIVHELSLNKWDAARMHNVVPGDIKKILRLTDT
jgi:hypothetical protein